jgi:hypothetical protein
MAATRRHSTPAQTSVLYVGLELSWSKWKLAMSPSFGQSPRWKTIEARDRVAFQSELLKAKQRFGLARVVRVPTVAEELQALASRTPATADAFVLRRHSMRASSLVGTCFPLALRDDPPDSNF